MFFFYWWGHKWGRFRSFWLRSLGPGLQPHEGSILLKVLMVLRSEIPSGMCTKLRTTAASKNRDHASQSFLLLLARATHISFCSSRTSRSWWITQSTQHHRRDCNNIPSLLQRTTPIARSLCEVWTRHDLPHPGRCTILLRLEILSGMCAKLCTMAASNNRDHVLQSLLLLLAHATHIYFCSSRTSRSWWNTQSTQHYRRGCNSGN